MRDPRFRLSETWWRQKAEVRARAEAELATLGARDPLVAAMAVLLEINDGAWAAVLTEAVPAFSELLRQDGEKFLEGDIDLRLSSWWTIAVALASSALAHGPSPSHVDRAAGQLHRAPAWVHDLHEDACVEVLANAPAARREAWLVELERPLEIVAPPPPPAGAVRVYRAEREWELRDVFDLWHDPPMAIEAVDAHAPTGLLRRLDPNRWFRSIEAWTDPRLVSGALFGDHVLHDRDALLTWLEMATPAFDPDGRWTGRTAAVILADHVVRHAWMLLEAVGANARHPDAQVAERSQAALRALRETELPAFFARAWGVLLARADGLVIAAALHAQLSDVGGVGGRRGALDPTEIACASLAAALAGRGVPTGQLRDLWASRHRTREEARLEMRTGHASGVCALLSALAVIEQRGAPGDEALLAMLLERMGVPDPDWAWFARQSALEKLLDRFVQAVAPRADVLARCERLYEELEPARRRGEYGRTYATNDTDLASVLVLLVLLGIVDEEVTDRARATEALERAVRWATRLVLTASPAFDPTLSVPHVFAFALRVCARLLPARLPEALAIALPDPALAAVATAAIASVLSPAALDELLRPQGASLEALEASAQAWAATTDRPTDRAAAGALATAREAQNRAP